MMIPYSLGMSLFNGFARVPVFSEAVTAFARIWLRHARWRSHLRFFRFDSVVDGGANIGEFSTIVREVLPQAHLLCIEPHPECATSLRKKGFEVVEAALWNQETTLNLIQEGPSTSSTVMKAASDERAIQVKTVRLCDLPIRGERILIKLDLQGAEVVALEALGSLEERCAAFLVEVSLSREGSRGALEQFFASRDYIPFASVNELFINDRQVEADILWIKKSLL